MLALAWPFAWAKELFCVPELLLAVAVHLLRLLSAWIVSEDGFTSPLPMELLTFTRASVSSRLTLTDTLPGLLLLAPAEAEVLTLPLWTDFRLSAPGVVSDAPSATSRLDLLVSWVTVAATVSWVSPLT